MLACSCHQHTPQSLVAKLCDLFKELNFKLALFLCVESPIRRAPCFWHQPSRVGKTFGCSFPMEQKISVRATILFSFGLLTFLLLVLDFLYLDLLEDFFGRPDMSP
jgi:hypothetical protein